jgi:hypothetical protein
VPDLLRSAEKSEGPSDRAPFLLVRFLWASKENERSGLLPVRWNLSGSSTRRGRFKNKAKRNLQNLIPFSNLFVLPAMITDEFDESTATQICLSDAV